MEVLQLHYVSGNNRMCESIQVVHTGKQINGCMSERVRVCLLVGEGRGAEI